MLPRGGRRKAAKQLHNNIMLFQNGEFDELFQSALAIMSKRGELKDRNIFLRAIQLASHGEFSRAAATLERQAHLAQITSQQDMDLRNLHPPRATHLDSFSKIASS